ncbi:nucleotide pyrophosphohydrolase [Sediminihabitans luteus]|nr:nucleotide pyrophosphohydrolase [Sediminihabitans luteus]
MAATSGPRGIERPSIATLSHMPHDRVREALRTFVAERDWEQFHTPENLAKSIAIESGELLECFQWGGNPDLGAVQEELADVLSYCFLMADRLGLDPDQIVLDKLETTRSKYPVEKARGSSAKYDQL